MKYEFKSTGDKKIDSIIKQFDKQIKAEYKFFRGNKENCPSYWHKLLFIKTLEIDESDWTKIRAGDYWEIRDSKHGIEQSKFIYERFIEYLG